MTAPTAAARRQARSEPSRRGFSTCRTRCRSTADRALTRVRVAYETYGSLSSQRDNVILVATRSAGAHAAGISEEAAKQSTRNRFGADDRDGTVGRDSAGGTG